MHSFLIASKNKKTANDYVNEFLNREKVNPLDRNINFYEKTMGIEDVRNIQKKIILKPFRGKTKAVVIQPYDGITLEAQNSLLKVLEEPPANTIIIISVSNNELLLPTIISRCKIIELEENNSLLSKEESVQYLNVLSSLSEKGTNYKLKLAQDIAATKDETPVWLEKMALIVRQKLIENYNDPKYSNFLRSLQKTYTIIRSTNVSQRIALENLFLSF